MNPLGSHGLQRAVARVSQIYSFPHAARYSTEPFVRVFRVERLAEVRECRFTPAFAFHLAALVVIRLQY